MHEFDVIAWLREAGTVLRLDDAEGLSRGEPVTLDGVAICASTDPDQAPCLTLMVDVGPLATGADRDAAVEALLALNFELDTPNQGAVGLDPDSGHALLQAVLDLDDLSGPDDLAARLKDYARLALQLRDRCCPFSVLDWS